MSNIHRRQVALYTTTVNPKDFVDGIYDGYAHLLIYDGLDKYPENDPDWIRVSDVVEVEFLMMGQDQLNNDEISKLKLKRTNIQAEAEAEITRITARIQELQALPAPEKS